MSMSDLFGSDLEDSEDEDKGKSRDDGREAQMDELFGDSPSEDEGKDQESGGEGDEAEEEEEEEEVGPPKDEEDENKVLCPRV